MIVPPAAVPSEGSTDPTVNSATTARRRLLSLVAVPTSVETDTSWPARSNDGVAHRRMDVETNCPGTFSFAKTQALCTADENSAPLTHITVSPPRTARVGKPERAAGVILYSSLRSLLGLSPDIQTVAKESVVVLSAPSSSVAWSCPLSSTVAEISPMLTQHDVTGEKNPYRVTWPPCAETSEGIIPESCRTSLPLTTVGPSSEYVLRFTDATSTLSPGVSVGNMTSTESVVSGITSRGPIIPILTKKESRLVSAPSEM
mmetsp:Transcript_19776/g.67357  ORF Transcript_19776/g.67357 Transcript_19776/m.67357 type:complete len:259 (+) Transcript_19776:1457-2233(+)